jgi:hypothetical protein
VPAGLAWDAVSRRFLFGDAQARRLFVAGEGSGRTVDLVRAETAGFDSVGAMAIDPRRGALWIASTAADGSGGTVHELQLISGRAVRAFRVPDAIESVRLTDLDVAGDGTVVVLDQRAPSVLLLRPGSATLELLVTLPAIAPASVAIAEHARTAYVAHSGGLLRIDVAAKTVAAVKAPGDLGLQGFERIRAHRNALVAVQAASDRGRRLVRLRLDNGGRSVTGGSVLEAETSAFPDPAYLTIVGDEAFYLAARPDSGSMTVVVRKVRLPDR